MRAPIRLGTSSWTAEGWETSFYPPGLPNAERIAFYAGRFDTVEIDMTYYRVPSARNVEGWRSRTPPGFLFAAKAPQAVTSDFVHEKGQRVRNPTFLDAEATGGFVTTMQGLGDRLGPLLLQFPYLARDSVGGLDDFLGRLDPLLGALPRGVRYAVELRNPGWFEPPLLEVLRRHRVSLCLTDLTLSRADGGEYGPPRGPDLFSRYDLDVVTGDHAFVRWLGNRQRIESKTTVFDRVIEPQDHALGRWAELILRLADAGVPVFAYANNHYEGYAPETLRKVRGLVGLPG